MSEPAEEVARNRLGAVMGAYSSQKFPRVEYLLILMLMKLPGGSLKVPMFGPMGALFRMRFRELLRLCPVRTRICQDMLGFIGNELILLFCILHLVLELSLVVVFVRSLVSCRVSSDGSCGVICWHCRLRMLYMLALTIRMLLGI